ncbi:protein NRT1/ PTR FAMILY 2.6-like [Nymphaea colorata]|nr:protein NRT1/ PTR FAMILY 2.6-like [Nymphaea colorata]
MTTKQPEYSDASRDSLVVQLAGNGGSRPCRKKGGWITFPFIIGTSMMLGLAVNGAFANIIVYLVQQFNVDQITAVQILNVYNGSTNITPVVGAIISDSCLRAFTVILISSLVSFVGLIPLTLTSILPSLRPSPCAPTSNPCETASAFQYAVLYISMALVGVGIGGTRFTIVTFGANQFADGTSREVFINWFFFSFYAAVILAGTIVVYVQDNVGWAWGYGFCLVANIISVIIFIIGKWHYKDVRPQGSPFTSIVRVLAAAIRKRRVALSPNAEDYFYQDDSIEVAKKQPCLLTPKFKFLNKAALVMEGDTHSNGTIAKSWRLCTTQQVEDLKTLIKILPIWSSSIFLSIPIGVQASMAILEALTMDRHLGSHFSIPASSFLVFTFLAAAIFIAVLDRVIYPILHKLLGWSPTLFQRIGAGHLISIMGMVAAALVEARRLSIAHSHGTMDQSNATVPMSALWLVAPLALVGAGEACHLPAQMSFYFEEFPAPLKGSSAAMMAVIIAIGFYLSAAVVKIVKASTSWLPNDINHGRMDKVFWMLGVVGAFNFCYFVLCAKLYKRKPSIKH